MNVPQVGVTYGGVVMKGFTQSGKERLKRSESFHRRLDSYALAAGTAGVSLLALAEPSAAEIVYTRTHHVIGNRSSYQLDLNHDGITDLIIENKYFHYCTHTETYCKTSETLTAKLAGKNQAVYNVYGAVAMKPGMRIGPGDAFRRGADRMVYCNPGFSYPSGSWINVKNRYVGIKFKIKGETHYGWARLSVQVTLPLTITATLTGYAYETVPNKPIIAGKTKEDAGDAFALAEESAASAPGVDAASNDLQPASLGALALGIEGVPLRRRRAF
jgi:hypothetical protein